MSREQQLLNFAHRLLKLSRAGDWALLVVADRELAVVWRRMALQGRWTPAERTALDALRQAHREAEARCADASQHVQQQMRALASRRDGLMAYVTDDVELTPAGPSPTTGATATSKVSP